MCWTPLLNTWAWALTSNALSSQMLIPLQCLAVAVIMHTAPQVDVRMKAETLVAHSK